MADPPRQTLVPKARKILNIRHPWKTDRSHLLQLPQELRDLIYELVLVELPLWDKRHHPACPTLTPEKGWQRPVYRTQEGDDLSSFDAVVPTNDQVETCRRLCRSRKGLDLRQVNRQICRETEEIFWRQNMFCYSEWRDLTHALLGCQPGDWTKLTVACHRAAKGPCLPVSAKQKLRRLSLREHQRRDGISFGEDMDIFLTALETLPSLIEVDLPASLLSRRTAQLAGYRFPELQTVHAGRIESIIHTLYLENHDAHLDLYFSRSFSMPQCSLDDTLGLHHVGREDQASCLGCRIELERIEQGLRQWYKLDGVQQSVVKARRMLLEGEIPTVSEQAVQKKYRVIGQDGNVDTFSVYCLPMFNETMRLQRAEQKREAALRASTQRSRNHRRSQAEGHVHELDVDYQYAPSTKQRGKSGHLKPSVWAFQKEAPSLEEKLAGRQEKREVNDRCEEKSAERKERRALRKGMRDMILQKEAVRKRAGRRSGW